MASRIRRIVSRSRSIYLVLTTAHFHAAEPVNQRKKLGHYRPLLFAMRSKFKNLRKSAGGKKIEGA